MAETYGLHRLVWDSCDQQFDDMLIASPADADGRGIDLRLRDGGDDMDLTGGHVYLIWRHRTAKARGSMEFTAVSAEDGTFTLYFPDALQGTEGTADAQILLSLSDGRKISSRTFEILCEKNVTGGDAAGEECSIFLAAVKKYEDAIKVITDAADAANAAADKATAAKDAIIAAREAGEFNGSDGIDGVNGQDGRDGADGVSCTHSWDGTVLTVTSASGTSSSDLQGPQGIQGPIGETGPQGEKGDKGDKGDTGETGPQGVQGVQGIQGVTGDTGPQGEKGDKGDKGDTGATGPQGETGATGEQGPQGETGIQGPAGSDGLAATIEVGNVTTGETASVVNVGTANAAIFNFVFPSAQGGTGMSVKQIQYFSKTGGSRAYLKGSLPGMCYYQADGNELYEWDGSAWVSAEIDSGTFYAFQGQLYPVVSGVIWGLGENWGSRDVRAYVSKDEDGYLDIALVSDCTTIRNCEVPMCIGYSSMSTGAEQGSNYVKRVDFTGCSSTKLGESTGDGLMQGMTNCQELLLPVGATLYCYTFLANLNTGGSTAVNTIHGYGKGGRKRPVLMFGGSVDEGTGPGTGFSASTFIHHAVCDFVYKSTGNTTMRQPATMGGTYAEYLASLVSFSAGYSTSYIQDVLHYDLWGCFTVTYTSTSASYPLFYVTGNADCVFEVGSAAFPVTQTILDAWGGITYWARQTNTGRVILLLYTEGGLELTVPAHTGASDLVVLFRDASARTVDAFHAKYDFATLFNTSTSADPRPDLSGDGITLV